MKRKFLHVCFLLLSVYLCSQETPIFYHYIFNKSYINPAAVGSDSKTTIRVGDMHSHLFKSNMPNYQVISLSDRLGNSGLGWFIFSDRATGLNAKAFQFSYSYHIVLKEDRREKNSTYLSVGISALTNLFIQEKSPGESITFTEENTKSDLLPNLNAGVYIYNNRFYSGMSLSKPFTSPYESLNSIDGENRNTPYYFNHTGYRWFTNEKTLVLEPSFLFLYKGDQNKALDANMKACIKQKYTLGLTHRIIERQNKYNHFICPSAVFAFDDLNIGYALDIPAGNHDEYSYFHHYFIVSYTVNYRSKLKFRNCPAYW